MMNSTRLRTLEFHAEVDQHQGRHAFALAHQPQQQMLRADVIVIETLRLFLRQ